jgi:hypothetical protein
MPRSSESVAALASALAKAQAQLVNPEKSLTATIKGVRSGEGDRIFRYAPLSSGLEIVRKTLGQHQIAAIQTTAIDHPTGIVNLTTMLAHASGEWIASDWPVCPIAEMASPRRMGAALTYARRYALFTLVGIAGEDDLDAPDLHGADEHPPGPTNGSGNSGIVEQGAPPLPRSSCNGQGRGAGKPNVGPVDLDPDQSAALRDRLLGEVESITETDKAATWARGVLAAKNSLRATDAKLVEDAFEQQLATLLEPVVPAEAVVPAMAASHPATTTQSANADIAGDDPPKRIDKSVLAVAEPRRYRNKAHLRYVAQQPCLVCGRKPSDAHHLRFMQPRAMGRKASDQFAVPLCRIHHRLVHQVGNEAAWWKESGIDPIEVARRLWGRTRRAEGREGGALSGPAEQDQMLPPRGGEGTPA